MVDKIKQNWLQYILTSIGSILVFVFVSGQIFGKSTNEIKEVKEDITEIKADVKNKVDKETFMRLEHSIERIENKLDNLLLKNKPK
jgi:hypothetical protein